MTTSLNGIFAPPKPHLKDYIRDNRRKVRQMSSKSTRSDGTLSSSMGSLTIKSKSPVRASKAKPAPPPADGAAYPRLRTKLFIQCRNQASQTDGEATTTTTTTTTTTRILDGSKVASDSVVESQERLQSVVFKEVASPTKEIEVLKELTAVENIAELPKKVTTRKNCRTASDSVTAALCEKSSKRVPPSYLKRSRPEPPAVVTDPDCPPGHVAVNDLERLEMLEKLNKAYHELIYELNKLPVGADTLRVRTMRIELEKRLDDIEENLKVYSKPKVYVKAKT